MNKLQFGKTRSRQYQGRLKGKPTTADRMREAIQTKRVQIAKENLERLLRGEGQPLEKLPPRPKNFRA